MLNTTTEKGKKVGGKRYEQKGGESDVRKVWANAQGDSGDIVLPISQKVFVSGKEARRGAASRLARPISLQKARSCWGGTTSFKMPNSPIDMGGKESVPPCPRVGGPERRDPWSNSKGSRGRHFVGG